MRLSEQPRSPDSLQAAPAAQEIDALRLLYQTGQLAKAENLARTMTRRFPGHPFAWKILGAVLQQMGRLKEALDVKRHTVAIFPEDAAALNNLGSTLRTISQLTEAEACFRSAIKINPHLPETFNNLGVTLHDLGRLRDAASSFRAALQLRPDYLEAFSNLLFSSNYIESVSPTVALEEARSYGALVSSKAMPKFRAWREPTAPNKLRIGLVSGDLRKHPVGYFLEGILKHFDQTQFELVAFTTTPITDELTQEIRPYFSDWISIHGKTDPEAAAIIHQQSIQVLIDLAGHSANNRLPVFSYRPAPVQVSWLGYFATTGLPEMDYLIGDPYMSPPEEASHFTETIWRLPATWFCRDPQPSSLHMVNLPVLDNGYVTFGCFGNISKMGDTVIQTWASILQQTPNSKLLLKSKQLADASNQARVRQAFEVLGITPNRLLIEGPSARPDYLASYRRVDMILDTFPYPGGTTSVDALEMGVPVLTMKGNRFLSHLGESIANNAGLHDWVADSTLDYIEKAVRFAYDIVRLENARLQLRQQLPGSPLFNTRQFALDFGAALAGMFNTKRAQLSHYPLS